MLIFIYCRVGFAVHVKFIWGPRGACYDCVLSLPSGLPAVSSIVRGTCGYAASGCHVFGTGSFVCNCKLVDVAFLNQLAHCFPMSGSSLALGSDLAKSRTSQSCAPSAIQDGF